MSESIHDTRKLHFFISRRSNLCRWGAELPNYCLLGSSPCLEHSLLLLCIIMKLYMRLLGNLSTITHQYFIVLHMHYLLRTPRRMLLHEAVVVLTLTEYVSTTGLFYFSSGLRYKVLLHLVLEVDVEGLLFVGR